MQVLWSSHQRDEETEAQEGNRLAKVTKPAVFKLEMRPRQLRAHLLTALPPSPVSSS